MAQKVARNTACPCGSGRKYKRCCGRDGAKAETAAGGTFTQKPLLAILIVVCLLAAGLVVGSVLWQPQHSATAHPEFSQPGFTPPPPWAYDAVNNRYWRADHGHWHDGRPPVANYPIYQPPEGAGRLPTGP
jgi:hypothetical protein